MPLELIESLTQFGAAGLMGMLWIWERRLSRRREDQLDEAHNRLVRNRHYLETVLHAIDQNTRAIERFEQTQNQLNHLIERMHDAIQTEAA